MLIFSHVVQSTPALCLAWPPHNVKRLFCAFLRFQDVPGETRRKPQKNPWNFIFLQKPDMFGLHIPCWASRRCITEI